jgi:SAM-dependent methyltransferase
MRREGAGLNAMRRSIGSSLRLGDERWIARTSGPASAFSMSAAAAGRRPLNWRAASARAVSSPASDISRLLIERARQLAGESRLANIRFEEGDAQTFPFPPQSFDVVFSRFGIMFFDDPDAAFANLRAALRPGGRMSFVCWPAPRENQFITIPIAAATRHITLPEPSDPDAPGPFAFAEPERVRRILSRAGFSDIETERVIEKVGGGTLDETANQLAEVGPLSSILDSIDEQTRRAIVADIRAALAGLASQGRDFLDAVSWLVSARSVEGRHEQKATT